MFMRMRRAAVFIGAMIAAHGGSTSAPAETLILKDGTFVEGRIILQTRRSVQLDTRFGTRSFFKKDIDQILDTIAPADLEVNRFHELPPALRAVLNAQADYALGNYERALERIEPFQDLTDNKAVRIRLDWLTIELYERMGRWEKVRELLEDKVEHGTPREKTRATAHLDIFERNPNYDLRYIGERHARNFIWDEGLRARARDPGSLRDAEVMRAGLEEYCEQLLVQDKLSVKAFADRLKLEETYAALEEASGVGDLSRYLPYMDDLKTAEAALYKAQSVLDEYGTAFELDLLRTELEHLIEVGGRLFNELIQASPEQFNPPTDATTGRLTAEGRREWVKRCDEFVALARPLGRLADYMIEKAERYPRDLDSLRRVLIDFDERLEQLVKSVKRNRDRTHG